MKIALVSPYDLRKPGGVQSQVRQLTAQLITRGHQAWVVGPGTPSDLGVDVGPSVTVPANGSRAPICLHPGAIGKARAGVADADVVHLHEPLMPVVGPALLSSRLNMVVTAHAAAPRWVQRVYRLTPARWWEGRVMTAVSSVAAASLPWQAQIISNGLDTAVYRSGEGKAPLRVAFLGRDDPRKGLKSLLDAWPTVRQKLPGAELVILGADGPPDREGVQFRGRVTDDDKVAELGRATVFAAPNTKGESFGITLVEGMAAGCAIVASNLPAFAEVTGTAARLVAPGDVAALAAAIVSLLEDPGEAARMGQAARRQAERFDWSVVTPRYLDCYLALSGRTASPG
ncbi:MAG TPA: glycosyltransferase family 4 protein [Acidimicrobiia bacterium]|nr:glycosyltransferase family 4 protein [Acidimicrobiia bacterium]